MTKLAVLLAGLSLTALPARAGSWTVRLVHKRTGLSAGLGSSEYPAGRPLILQRATKAADQRWLATSYPPAPGTSPGSRGYLSLKSLADELYAGARIQTSLTGCAIKTWPDLGPTDQWQMIPAGDGWFKLRNRASQKVLGVLGDAKDPGGPLVQWDDNGTDDQKWRMVTDAGAVLDSQPWAQCLAFCEGCSAGKCVYLGSVRSMEETRDEAFAKLRAHCRDLAKKSASFELRVGFRHEDPVATPDSPGVCR